MKRRVPQQVVIALIVLGFMVAGLEVPHCHIHLVPIRGVHDLDFANAAVDVDPMQLDAAAQKLREALRDAGHNQFVID